MGPKPFEFKIDDGNCADDWNDWIRGFEIFARANEIVVPALKRDWLLHYAGPKVQSIYFNLIEQDETNDEPERCGPLITGFVPFERDCYIETVTKLQNFFAPKRNLSFERHVFRKMMQEKKERIDSYVMRLRIQAKRCGFEANLDENIKDQITSGCFSDSLRRKILERGDDDLNNILKMARIYETVADQQKEFSVATKDENKPETAEVCKIGNRTLSGNRTFYGNRDKFSKGFGGTGMECARCGYKGHKSGDDKCPAIGKSCSKCGKTNHFARKCRTRNAQDVKKETSEPPFKSRRDTQPIQAIEQTQQYDDFEDVFCDTTASEANTIWCTIGGIELKAVVDSGSRYNIVDRDTWTELKAKNVQTTVRTKEVDIGFVAYGGHPLKFLGMFEAIIKTANKQMLAKFYVADEFGKLLLGFETAIAMKVLKIGQEINKIESTHDGKLSKIKGIVVDIPIDPNAKAIQQPYRRIPAPLEKIVDDKIQGLLDQGIIEKVETSNWISPLVVVPKDDGNDVRVCVDMRRVNEAVIREKHPLPTIDDFLPEFGGAKWFSKCDVKSAFHQVDITK